ncbi:MAG: hypothetical protein ACFFCT_07400 [Candidatus Odinarchaeota archaeon]
MSIDVMILLFVLSIIFCWGGSEMVKRRNIRIPKIPLALFHLVYVIGLVAAYILL